MTFNLKQSINLLGLLILLFASSISCKSNTAIKEPSALTFITGDCFGSCQVYKVTFFSMGKLVFTGKKNVKKIGNSTYNIPKDLVKGIYDDFYNLHLKTKTFNSNLRDFPEKKLIYGKDTIRIKGSSNAPIELVSLIENIESTIDSYVLTND